MIEYEYQTLTGPRKGEILGWDELIADGWESMGDEGFDRDDYTDNQKFRRKLEGTDLFKANARLVMSKPLEDLASKCGIRLNSVTMTMWVTPKVPVELIEVILTPA